MFRAPADGAGLKQRSIASCSRSIRCRRIGGDPLRHCGALFGERRADDPSPELRVCRIGADVGCFPYVMAMHDAAWPYQGVAHPSESRQTTAQRNVAARAHTSRRASAVGRAPREGATGNVLRRNRQCAVAQARHLSLAFLGKGQQNFGITRRQHLGNASCLRRAQKKVLGRWTHAPLHTRENHLSTRAKLHGRPADINA